MYLYIYIFISLTVSISIPIVFLENALIVLERQMQCVKERVLWSDTFKKVPL